MAASSASVSTAPVAKPTWETNTQAASSVTASQTAWTSTAPPTVAWSWNGSNASYP